MDVGQKSADLDDGESTLFYLETPTRRGSGEDGGVLVWSIAIGP